MVTLSQTLHSAIRSLSASGMILHLKIITTVIVSKNCIGWLRNDQLILAFHKFICSSSLSRDKRFGDVFFDMHMMVAQPDTWIEPMKDAGANQYTFHIEATSQPRETCRKVREAGMKVGIGLKPNTPVDIVEEYVNDADMILIMTVEPGNFAYEKILTTYE